MAIASTRLRIVSLRGPFYCESLRRFSRLLIGRSMLFFNRALIRLPTFIAATKRIQRAGIRVSRAQARDRLVVAPAALIRVQRRFKPEAVGCLVNIKAAALVYVVRLFRIAQADPPLLARGIDRLGAGPFQLSACLIGQLLRTGQSNHQRST